MADTPTIPRQPTSPPNIGSEEDEPAKIAERRRDALIDEDIQDRQADRDLRKEYANKAFKLARDILSVWALVILSEGMCTIFTCGKVQLFSDKTMIAITAGATANVFAAFLGVIRGLFPVRSKK